MIHAATRTEITRIDVGDIPLSIALSPDGERVYVANHSDENISVLDGINLVEIETIEVGILPYGVSVHPFFGRVYVTNLGSEDVSVIDTEFNEVSDVIDIGYLPSSLGIFIPPVHLVKSVPTLSQWGIIILGLIFLVLGTVACGKILRFKVIT